MSIAIQLCSTADDFAGLRASWNRLAADSPARSLFLTWAWLDACRRTLARSGQLAIVCAMENGRLVGAAPCIRRRARYYGIAVTETAFLGDPISDRQFFLDSSPAFIATQEIWRFLASNPFRTRLLRLEQVPCDSTTLTAARTVLPRVEIERSSRLPFLSVRSSWLEFERGLPAKFRSEMRTRTKVFDSFGEWGLENVHGPSVLEHLEGIARVEVASGKGGRGYAFLQQPKNIDCVRAFVAAAGTEGVQPTLLLLRIEGKIAAYLLGFVYDTRFHAYNMAYLPEYRKGSPGKYVMHQAIRHAHDIGASEFDFLRGEFFMKHEWSPGLRENCRCVHFYGRGPGTLLRWLVFRVRPRLKRLLTRVQAGRLSLSRVDT